MGLSLEDVGVSISGPPISSLQELSSLLEVSNRFHGNMLCLVTISVPQSPAALHVQDCLSKFKAMLKLRLTF